MQIRTYFFPVYNMSFHLPQGIFCTAKVVSFIRSNISVFLFYPLWSYFSKAGSQSTCFGISQVLVTKPVCLDPSPNFLNQILRVGSGSLLFKKLLENLVIQTDWPQVFMSSCSTLFWVIPFIPTTCLTKYVQIISTQPLWWTLEKLPHWILSATIQSKSLIEFWLDVTFLEPYEYNVVE